MRVLKFRSNKLYNSHRAGGFTAVNPKKSLVATTVNMSISSRVQLIIVLGKKMY